jgi:hypothetical protein
MIADQKDYHRAVPEALHVPGPYRISMLVVAIASFGWIIPFGIAGYKFDQCSESLHVRLDSIKARLDGMKTGTDGAKSTGVKP